MSAGSAAKMEIIDHLLGSGDVEASKATSFSTLKH
jgi:hypothetical protein